MKNAYAYYRFSSDRQNESSIEAQRRACEEYAAGHDITIIRHYADEAISGKGSATAKRAQYQLMMRDAKRREVSVILVHKYDRIARNLGEHVNMETRLSELGIDLIAVGQEVGTTKESKIVKTLLWSLSEYYIDNLADETRKGLREVALQGRHTGGYPPFGYDVADGHYIINDLEAEYVRRMFENVVTGAGNKILIEEMRLAGIKGKRGAEIKYTQIYEILRNERYTGVYIYSTTEESGREGRRLKPNAIRIEGAMPQIIDKDTFNRVQIIMASRKLTGKPQREPYLCAGLVYCFCGEKMRPHHTQRKGHDYYKYRCSAKCGAESVDMSAIDDAAKAYLSAFSSEDVQREISEAMSKYKGLDSERVRTFDAAVKARIKETQSKYEAYLSAVESGVLTPLVMADISQRMETLRHEMEALACSEPPTDYTPDIIKNWFLAIKKAPTNQAVTLLIERIEVDNKSGTTDFNILSTLKSVVQNTGCGGRI